MLLLSFNAQMLLSPAAPWLNSLATFFTWPKDLQFWAEMEMSALNQLADLKSRMEAKLEFMMSNHANVLANIRIKAPVVIISESGDPTAESDLLVLDLGMV
jgi:hypothetical protein